MTDRPRAVDPAPYAGFWKRSLAMSIDGAILLLGALVCIGAIVGVQFWVMRSGAEAAGGELSFWDVITPTYFQTVVMVVSFLLNAVYYTVLTARTGSTIGKRICRIRVVDATTQQNLSMAQSFWRYLATMVSGLPLGAGYLLALCTARKQTLHDLMAHSISLVAPPNK